MRARLKAWLTSINGTLTLLILTAVMVPAGVGVIGVGVLFVEERRADVAGRLERAQQAMVLELSLTEDHAVRGLEVASRQEQLVATMDLLDRFRHHPDASTMLVLETKRLADLLETQAQASQLHRLVAKSPDATWIAGYNADSTTWLPTPGSILNAGEEAQPVLYPSPSTVVVRAIRPVLRWSDQQDSPVVGYLLAEQVLDEKWIAALAYRLGVALGVGSPKGPVLGYLPANAQLERQEAGSGWMASIEGSTVLIRPIGRFAGEETHVITALSRDEGVRAMAGRHAFFLLALLLTLALLLPLIRVWARRSVVAPLARLSELADRVAAGDYSRNVAVRGSHELARLSNAFNTMVRAIQQRQTDLLASEARYRHLSKHDSLTQLHNRSGIEEAMGSLLADSSVEQLALLFLDLDRFAEVNDTLGHPVGDALLRELGWRLQNVLGERGIIARMGGDEFLVLFPYADSDRAGALAEELIAATRSPFRLASRNVEVKASVGVALYPVHGKKITALQRAADVAMYAAKHRGGNGYAICDESMIARVRQRFEMEAQLRDAIDRREFLVYYQPQVRLADATPFGLEALVRWRRADGTLVPPDEFIPLAEQTGMIAAIGEQVLEQACQQTREWLDAGFALESISVNLSSFQLQRPDLLRVVHGILEQSGLPPAALVLEMTESMIMQDSERVTTILRGLRDLGVELAVDDFGTGYSSLDRLRLFPIQELKIDQRFVEDSDRLHGGRAIVRAIIALAEALDLRVVAEGIETRAQAEFLVQTGCSCGQGFLYSKPVPAHDVPRLLARAERAC